VRKGSEASRNSLAGAPAPGLRSLRLDVRRFSSRSREARSVLSLFILVLITIVVLADTYSWFGGDQSVVSGGAAGLGAPRSEPSAADLIHPSAVALALPRSEAQPDGLLRDAAGWCGGQQVSFGGRAEDGATVLLRLAHFRDAEAATRAVAGITPTALGELVETRMVTPPEPADPPLLLPAEVVLALAYGGRVPMAMRTEADPPVLPVALLLVQAESVVVLVESIGLLPERQQALVVELVRAARQLPPWDC
jgi:hypothetical protein